MTRRHPAVLVGLLVLVLVAAGLVVWRVTADPEFTAPKATGEKPADEQLGRFYDQSLDWRECGSARCTTVQVPVDYADPGGETVSLAVKFYPASQKSERTIFVNPGGPGGSALDYAASMSRQFGRGVTDVSDVVGVDPRGVGKSTPLKCLSDMAFDSFVATDPDPDEPAEITALSQSISDLGEACEKNSGALSAHVSTEEVARDMDVVRALLGRAKLDWFGASYGTQLGATYAELFPDKVGRMVLDGAVDPQEDSFESALGQATGFQRAFDSYAAYCLKKDGCPLGSSVAEARSTVSDLLTGLEDRPMRTQQGRELTEGAAFYGVALPLYSEESWDVLTQALTRAIGEQDGSVLQALSDAYFTREPDGKYATNIGQVITAVSCLDADDNPTLDQVEARLPEFEKASPVFGRSLGWGVAACGEWPIEATTPQQPTPAEGAPPIVVVGTTRDPATPYESAVALAKELTSGVLLTRNGDGHTAYNAGNDCINDTIDAYLVDGTVPQDGKKC